MHVGHLVPKWLSTEKPVVGACIKICQSLASAYDNPKRYSRCHGACLRCKSRTSGSPCTGVFLPIACSLLELQSGNSRGLAVIGLLEGGGIHVRAPGLAFRSRPSPPPFLHSLKVALVQVNLPVLSLSSSEQARMRNSNLRASSTEITHLRELHIKELTEPSAHRQAAGTHNLVGNSTSHRCKCCSCCWRWKSSFASGL